LMYESKKYKLSTARLQPACALAQDGCIAWSFEFSYAP
jgi:hypothetical protein